MLPAPRGPAPVGRRIFDWTDSTRNRELMVFVWYPAQIANDAAKRTPSPILPERWSTLAQRRFLPGDVRGSAIADAPVADGRHPLLILLPAMGGIPTDYTTIAEDLASYGYIVAGITPTGSARVVVFSNGRVVKQTDDADLERRDAAQQLVEQWRKDVRYVRDQLNSNEVFAPHIDAQRTGIFGHSFGGAVALHVLAGDPEFQRGANIDGAPEGDPIGKLERPVLFFNGADLPPSQRTLNDAILHEMKTICANDSAGCVWRDTKQAGHMNFSDLGAMPLPLAIPYSHFSLTSIDGPAFLYSVCSELRAFFGGNARS